MKLFKDEVLERTAREAIRLDESKALLDRFVTLVRESGTPDEETAGRYIADRLTALGVPYDQVKRDFLLSNGAPGMNTLSGSISRRESVRPTRSPASRSLRKEPPHCTGWSTKRWPRPVLVRSPSPHRAASWSRPAGP